MWEEKIPGVHGSGQEGFGMAREAEDRSTHIVYEKDRIGEVKIADEVVAIIGRSGSDRGRRCRFDGWQYHK